MTSASHPIGFAAACLLLALQPAVAVEPGAAPQHTETVYTPTSAVVAQAAPAVQGSASAPIGATSDAAVPVARTAVDWSYTPRRTSQARRR
jgi:hypothetical protein